MDEYQINMLKKHIEDHLKHTDVLSSLRGFIVNYVKEMGGEKEGIYDALKEKGVIDDIIKSLNLQDRPSSIDITKENRYSSSTHKKNDRNGKRLLSLRIMGGRAFVGSLTEEIHEPVIDESFIIELQDNLLTDVASLLSIDDPIHIVLIKHTITDEGIIKNLDKGNVLKDYLTYDSGELFATQKLEWRRCLGRGGLTLSTEINSVGQEAKMKVPAGILDLRLDLIPDLSLGATIPQTEISRQLRHEVSLEADAQRSFYTYARAWWDEYLQISPSFKQRLVKIFAENEWSEHRCVCTFLSRLRAGRVIKTPFEAARFVSLIPYNRSETIGGGRDETWHSYFTSLSLGKLDCEGHVLLLASLLLGFGLDAFVCVGTVDDDLGGEKEHVWVMTRPSKRDQKAIFWESLTGQRFSHEPSHPEQRQHPYKRIGCIFNDKSFYANKHPSDAVESCLFELEHDGLWKSMDSKLIEALPHQSFVPLRHSPHDSLYLADNIEKHIKSMITNKRRSVSLSTNFDESLCYILTPALECYENERLTGIQIGQEEVQQAIKNSVPQGHSFKGFPIMFNHTDHNRILDTLQDGVVSSDIIQTVGDRVSFGVRVHIVAYAEKVIAVWVMIACRFRPLIK